LRVLDAEARELMEVCGACERIRGTPLPRSYRVFLWQAIVVLLSVLPWSVAGELGYWSAALAMFEAYLFCGIESIAEGIDEPFGPDADDLDLEAYCRAIETTLRQVVESHAAAPPV
jgi:ion channel-forming bestrophin family protein